MENRKQRGEYIQYGKAHGLLAYLDGRVVGVATVSDAKIVTVDNSLVLHTTAPLPFRTDYNPRFRLHVLVNGTVILKPVTRIRTGDLLYNYDESKWVPVTKVDLEFGGNHTVYDLTTNPVTDFIANGYADCPKICPNSPSEIGRA